MSAVKRTLVSSDLLRSAQRHPNRLVRVIVQSRTSTAQAFGVGEVQLAKAVTISAPPNPNKALNQFVKPDPLGGTVPVFDAASWSDAAKASASWDAASWSDAAWGTVVWSLASWSDASWSDASWSDASWSDVSWSDASSEDAAANDSSTSGYRLTLQQARVLLGDPDLAPDLDELPPDVLTALQAGQN